MDELTRRGAIIGGIAAGLAAAAGVPAATAEESKKRSVRGGGRSDASATGVLGIQLQDIDIDLNGIQYKIPSIPIFPIPIARVAEEIVKVIVLPDGTQITFRISANAMEPNDDDSDSWTVLQRITSDEGAITFSPGNKSTSRRNLGFTATATATVSWPW